MAGALGVAWAIFRSASEAKLREIDKRLIESQATLIAYNDAELAKERVQRATAELAAQTYRDSLTQKAAVDHLADILANAAAAEVVAHEMHTMLLKDIVAQLRGQRGQIG